MPYALILAALCPFLAAPQGGDLPLDSCRDAAVWTPFDGAQTARTGVIDGKQCLILPCDMRGEHARAYWDRQVNLDLSRQDRIAFSFYLQDLSKVSGSFNVYFQSGEGWFTGSFPAEKGWNRVTLAKAELIREGTPDGWSKISTIRIGAWKSREDGATMALADLRAVTSEVAVVQGDDPATAATLTSLLHGAGIEAGSLTGADVEAGALRGRRFALFSDVGNLSNKAVDEVSRFVDAGGHPIVLYGAPARLMELIGVRSVGWKRQDFAGQFAAMKFASGIVDGLPRLAKQASWNVNIVEPAGKNARVVGEWQDSSSRPTGIPALIVSDAGAYFSHILLSDDHASKERTLLALLGGFDSKFWRSASERAITAAPLVGEFTTIGQFPPSPEVSKAKALLQGAVSRTDDTKSLDDALRAHDLLVTAYCAAQKPKAGEMRSAWCHSAAGVPGMTWDQVVKAVADSGFNAVMPNMLWGGLAYYKSAILPVDPSVAKDGDRIAQCVAAGNKYGVRVHVWKVNWNLGTAPREFLSKMRADGRTQKDPTGKDIDWLCPSNPANFELERDSMLEVARNYAVAGLHFDYIRYPGSEGCYCDGCRQRFEQQYAVRVANWPKDVIDGPQRKQYAAFRRSNITRLVKAVSEDARKIRPGIEISAAVFSDWPNCRETVGQDWVQWLKDGYLDFACPMDYTPSATQYDQWMIDQSAAIGTGKKFRPGIGATLGTWTLTPDQVARQVVMGRKRGSSGFILFNLDEGVIRDILPKLRLGISRSQGSP